MEWNKENTMHFIKLIKERPLIWDVSSVDRKNKQKKLESLMEVGIVFGITKEEVNSKWISLKGQYSREKKKMAGMNTGSEAAEIKTKWFAYHEIDSLLSCIPQESVSNVDNAISPQAVSTQPPTTPTQFIHFPTQYMHIPTQYVHFPTPSPPSVANTPITTPTAPPSLPPSNSTRDKNRSDPFKRSNDSNLYGDPLLTLKASKKRKRKTLGLRDEITSYGLYIAAQMRKFHPILQSKLKLDIQTLLCKYEMENIEYSSRSNSSMSDNSGNNNVLNNASCPSSPIASTSTYRQPEIMPTISTIRYPGDLSDSQIILKNETAAADTSSLETTPYVHENIKSEVTEEESSIAIEH